MTALIRRPQATDIRPLTDLYNHYIRTTTITFDIEPFTLEQRAEWFHHYAKTGRHQLLIAELAGDVVGYASSSQLRTKAAYDTSVETSVYLDPKAQGKGIGSQLYQALFEALATEDVHRAYAGITLPNQVSIAIHKKFGFESVGTYREVGRKFGRYWDVEWFEKAL
ncbi:MAG: N-acetyltransferase [Leptolyngbyaceae cyanobacterium SL_1_1]|nr:N-acetyltransferase [Leptolyngbyaceae cyanobacterium RM1_1_2]NJO09735.1 N-acetyltransferase [Leptolyngbyaceae cyanobacterium SL_1_1]